MASLPPPVSRELPGNPAGGKEIYTVQLPDGSEVDVEGPANATPEQLQRFVASQGHHVAVDASNDPAPLVDSGTYMEGSFGDDPQPREVSRKLSPEDEAQLLSILQTGTAADARRFAASKGFAGPDNFDEVIAQRDKGHGVNRNLTYHLPDMTAQSNAAGAWARGVGDTVSAGWLDELGAVADTLGGTKGRENVFNSKKSFSEIFHHNLDANRGILDADEADHPTARLVGQITGGMVLPAGTEGVALRAGKSVLRAGGTLREARAAAAIAVRDRMAYIGAGYGAAHGMGSAEGGLGPMALGGLAEAGEGATGGVILGGITQAVAPRLAARAAAARAAPLTEPQQTAAAAERLGIDLLPADVGGPMTRRATSMTSQTIAGGAPIINAANRMTEQSKAARDQVAQAFGQVLQPEAAGQAAITAARRSIARTSARGNQLYTAASQAAGDAKIRPVQALANLDAHIAELSETPGADEAGRVPGLDVLRGLRDSLAKGDFTVRGLRNLRSTMRQQFEVAGLRGSDEERRGNQAIDALTSDIVTQLRTQGRPDAAKAYALADRYWASRLKTIDQTLEPIIGTAKSPRSAEQVVKSVRAAFEGNNARAISFLRTLDGQEAGDFRASIIGSLGRATAGKQDADGQAFSLSTFLTHWSQIGERAKTAYFGREGRAALNDLAQVAQGAREAQGYANMSNTGGVIGNLLTLASGAGGVVTFGKTVGAQYLMGRLLSSPRFARWLARAPRTSLSAPAYVDRLSRIARAEPAIANEVLQLQQRLREAFTSVPTRAAADESLNESGGVQRDNQQ